MSAARLFRAAAPIALLSSVALPALAHADPAEAPQAQPAMDQASANTGQDGGSSGKGGVTQSAAPAAAQAPTVTDQSLGTNPFVRFFKYQAAELGQTGSPITDPNAPPGRRQGWTPQPETSPPMPFTEWSYGGATSLGVNRPSSVDSPLMTAIGDTGFGKLLSDAHIQAYGWIDVGANLSTSHVAQGNSPAAYDFNPNTVQLDQAVLYIERTPDTVQTDHVDWGFRVSGIYGTDYRYTTSYGLFSYQLLKYNRTYGYDTPMLYAEVYIPQVASGLLIRAGRFISLPDIEAQLAPNNYMYSHSITYTLDNYTNTGIQATLAVNKNLFLQFGITAGSDTAIWNVGEHIANPDPNPLFPGATFLKDPGAKPSYTGCLRYQTDSANDNIYLCADAINSGTWGYNNLQWYGLTYYHKFNDKFHVSFETYNLHESDVPNLNNPVAAAALAAGGTPFTIPSLKYNAPGAAYCHNTSSLRCTATAQSVLAYFNYQFAPLDNLSLRTEYYNDEEGQRTGAVTQYAEVALGWQHWLSPQIELRPEVAYYNSINAKAFDGDSDAGIAPKKNFEYVLSGDAILHF
jgi:hypothetical protein